jgi:hypothetical protein
LPTQTSDDLVIGASLYNNYGFYGRIEDVRIYDQKLSDAQVSQLAQDIEPSITPVLKPLTTSADIVKDNKVDFKDLRSLVQDWVSPQNLWPAN